MATPSECGPTPTKPRGGGVFLIVLIVFAPGVLLGPILLVGSGFAKMPEDVQRKVDSARARGFQQGIVAAVGIAMPLPELDRHWSLDAEVVAAINDPDSQSGNLAIVKQLGTVPHTDDYRLVYSKAYTFTVGQRIKL